MKMLGLTSMVQRMQSLSNSPAWAIPYSQSRPTVSTPHITSTASLEPPTAGSAPEVAATELGPLLSSGGSELPNLN